MGPLVPFPPGSVAEVLARMHTAGRSERLDQSVPPDLPPIAETMSGYNLTNWLGILAPVGMPPDVVTRAGVELVAIPNLHEMRGRLVARGADPIGDSPDEFAAHIWREITRFDPIKRALRARFDRAPARCDDAHASRGGPQGPLSGPGPIAVAPRIYGCACMTTGAVSPRS
jgi:hypothetical protein